MILLGIAMVILSISVAVAWFTQSKDPLAQFKTAVHVSSLTSELAKPKPELRAVVGQLEAEAWDDDTIRLETEEAIRKSTLSGDEKAVAIAYWKTLNSDTREPEADLIYAAHWVKPLPMANELVADLWQMQNEFSKARRYYEREIKFHDSRAVREKLVNMLLQQNDFASLSSMASDARFKELIPQHALVMLAVHEHQWRQTLLPIAEMEVRSWKPVPATLALVAGAIWMLIALQAIQPSGWFCFRSLMPFVAVVLGMASTFPTLFVDLWEGEVLGLRHTGFILRDFTFFMAGVGVREEIIKLVFFLPLVPFLLRRKNRLETLMIGACVGLGFAIQENLQYFEAAGPANAFGRFLTANFFHMGATGILSLALCDALREPREKGMLFFGILAAVMISHGAYDAFMAVPIPEFGKLKAVSVVSFILLSRFFFDQLRRCRDGTTDQISIAATLAIGLSILSGVIFVCASMQLGFFLAALALAFSAVGLIVFFLMFYRQLGYGMSAEAVALSTRPSF